MATAERLIIESMFRIPDKDGNDVDFKLNREQAMLDSMLTARNRVPKARQLGISTYVLGNFTAKCLHKRNSRCVVISHDKESTQRMLSKVHYMLENIKGPKAQTKLANKNEITFPKTGSMFYIGTAGARKFGRGDTITDLHCSEIAYWPDPKSLTAGLYQAVPYNGLIIEESTGNGVGNYYHRGCMNAYEGKGRWRLHFFNWLKFPEYFRELSAEEANDLMMNLKEEWEEPRLIKAGLTPGQIAWRRDKLEEMDYDLRQFHQEYPVTLDECFQSTGYSLFQNVNYEPTERWVRHDAHLWVLEDELRVAKDNVYAIGADVAGGVGRDRSVAQIINITKNEQVGEWVADNISPDMFAYKLAALGEMFGNAFITVETNNHGGMTLMQLKDIYPQWLLYSRREDTDKVLEYGYQTTAKTKPLLINNLRREFREKFTIHSPALRDELGTFVEKDTGKLEAEAGCHDDRVMSLAVGLMGAMKAHLQSNLETKGRMINSLAHDPFSLEGMLASIKKLNHSRAMGDGPIPKQHIDVTDYTME
jgi:hypothetical protein